MTARETTPARTGLAGRASKTSALIVLAMVATAFNDLPAILPVGELSKDGFIYFLPFLFLLLLRDPAEIASPTGLTLFVIAFFLVMAIGIVANFDAISLARYRFRTGMGRVITQTMTLGFGFFIALLFYNFALRGYLPEIIRGARIGIMVMAGVGLLEFASWFDIPGPTQLYDLLSTVIHHNAGGFIHYPDRLRTTAFEVSWAAVVLTFLFPFAIASGKVGPRMRFFLFFAVYTMMILAQSRTAMLVIAMQSLLLLWFYLKGRLDRVIYGVTAVSVIVLAALITPSVRDQFGENVTNLVEYGNLSGAYYEDDLDENISNVTRLVAVRTGMEMFAERPIVGVGFGQYGFNYPKYLRSEDFRSWEVREYAVAGDDAYGWPPTYSLHVRLLAETGILGYALWIGLVLGLTFRSLRNADMQSDLGRAHFAVAATLLGWVMLGISMDSFRFFGGWITIGVAAGLPAYRSVVSTRGFRMTRRAVAGR